MNIVLFNGERTMKKSLIPFGIFIIGIIVLLILPVRSLYRIWEESRIAKGVTISVKDSSNSPIPAAIIRLERLEPDKESTFALQLQTDQNGEIYIRSLTSGLYIIRATQIYCDGGKSKANTISLNVQGQNTHIQYFPCA